MYFRMVVSHGVLRHASSVAHGLEALDLISAPTLFFLVSVGFEVWTLVGIYMCMHVCM